MPPISAKTLAIVNPKLGALGPTTISSRSDSSNCIGLPTRYGLVAISFTGFTNRFLPSPALFGPWFRQSGPLAPTVILLLRFGGEFRHLGLNLAISRQHPLKTAG